jgi:tetratricopeptide (TPR) repeat protein
MGVTVALDPDALAALEEQRSFLRRSLADLEREHAAGDVDDTDFDTLLADYRRRLQEVEHAVTSGRAELAANRRSWPLSRTVAVWLGVLAFGALLGVLVSRNMATRGAGQEITGAPAAEARAQNIACLDKANSGGPAAAAGCYQDILDGDPDNVEALTYLNGFTAMTAEPGDSQTLSHALLGLLAARDLEPDYPDLHAFLAITNVKLGNFQKAQDEFEELDALDPSPLMSSLVARFREETARQLGLPSPASPAPPTAGP